MKTTISSKRLFYGTFAVLGLLFFIANFSIAEKSRSEELTFENVILPYEKAVGDADYLFQVVEWNANLHSDDDGLFQLLNIYEEKLQNLINDEESFKRIKALHEKYVKDNAKGEKTQITAKWYNYLNRMIVLDPKAKELQKREMNAKNVLSSAWNTFRPKMKGADGRYINDKKSGKTKLFNNSEVVRILSGSSSRAERKGAFEAQSEVGFELSKKGFKELVALRNEFARARGFSDFYSMKYSFAGLDEKDIFKTFDDIAAGTDKVVKEAIAAFMKKEGLNKFEPWDAEYASGGFSGLIDGYLPKDGMTEILIDTFKDVGINIPSLNIRMDLEPRPGKYPHAACWWVRFADFVDGKWQGEDMRLMANLDKGGIDQYSTLFHEAGHAVHGANVRQKYLIDKDTNLTSYYEMAAMGEGVADTFEKMIFDKDWFIKYAGRGTDGAQKFSKDELGEAFDKYEKSAKPWEAFNFRKLLTRVYFEREIYRNPDADFNKTWWDQMQRFLFVERHDEFPHWGHKIHFVTPAGYYQSYAIADLISVQNLEHFRKVYGKVIGEKNVGRELREKYFEPGNSVPWEKMVINLTGEKLNPSHMVEAATKF